MGRVFPPENQVPYGPATELRTQGKGSSKIKRFKELKREFPYLETHELWALVDASTK